MSTSLLYHAFDIRGYQYVRTAYEGGETIFTIRQERRTLRCAACGSRAVFANRYSADIQEIEKTADTKDVVSKAHGLIKKMLVEKTITPEQYNDAMDKLNRTEKLYSRTGKFKAMVKSVLYALGGYKLGHVVGWF